jgi:hypothetical protein
MMQPDPHSEVDVAEQLDHEVPPLACVLEAIPPGERPRHAERTRRLFPGSHERVALADGYAFRFPAAELLELAHFIKNERRCCPFLRFELALEPAGGDAWLRITGPSGTRSFLEIELPLHGG